MGNVEHLKESLLEAKAASALLSISGTTIYALCESGKLAHYRIGSGRGTLRFKREDVQAYLESCYRPAEDALPGAATAPVRRRRNVQSLRGLRFVADCLPAPRRRRAN